MFCIYKTSYMHKAELRKIYLDKRQSLSKEEMAAFNGGIHSWLTSYLEQHPSKKCILAFKSIAKKHEPDISIIMNMLYERSYSLAFPKVIPGTTRMEAILHTPTTTYIINEWGIPEAQQDNILLPESIDIVLLPLLAFDKTGNRLGYGKGMYDRYLERCKPDVLKIGISFFEPIDTIRDIGPHDKKMDACISPKGIYTFL